MGRDGSRQQTVVCVGDASFRRWQLGVSPALAASVAVVTSTPRCCVFSLLTAVLSIGQSAFSLRFSARFVRVSVSEPRSVSGSSCRRVCVLSRGGRGGVCERTRWWTGVQLFG